MMAIVVIPMFIIGVALLISGRQTRRADGREDGIVKTVIGATLVPLALIIGVVPSLVDAVVSDDTSADSQPPNQTSDDVYSALRGATTYVSTIKDLQLDIEASDGTRAAISFSDDDASGEIRPRTGKIDLIRVDGETYLLPSDSFWPAARKQEAIDLIEGRWIHVVPGDPVFGGLVTFGDRSNALKLLDSDLGITRTDGKTVNGVKCSGFKVKSAGATLYISEGSYQSQLLQFVDRDGSVGTLSYEASPPTPAKPTQVVESSEIFPASQA